jgi:hypothetical protein
MFNTYIRNLLIFSFLFCSYVSPVFAKIDYIVEDQPQVIEQVLYIPSKGILKQKKNGYLYVEVSNDFIAFSLPLIDVPGQITPPHDYTSKKGIGAHISVIDEKEMKKIGLEEIEELGLEFNFSILELRTVDVHSYQKTKKLWLLAVASAELENLRVKYGFSPFLKGHDYHITLGTEIETPVFLEEKGEEILPMQLFEEAA